MAEESFQEKTEPATSRKREEARRKGQVHKSVEMNSAFILVFGLMILYFSGAALATNLASVARTVFSNAGAFEVNQANIQRTALSGFMSMAVLLAPISLGLMIVGVGANFAQVGYLFSFEAITPKMEKLNPLHGMKRLLISRRSLVELTKNLLKIGIVGLAAYYALRDSMAESLLLIDGDAEGVLGFMARASLAVGFKTGLAFLVLAVLDYIFQRFEYEREMRMTKEEVKEEEKTTEGDPLTRSRIKGVQRKIAYRRMMQDVPGADVVVTNPTHIAVALKYEVEDMSAPRVVAKGADLIAARIREIAQEHGVPIVEDKPLARALYASVEIGDQIPEKLFQAVAQLLAYIYRVKNAKPTFGLN